MTLEVRSSVWKKGKRLIQNCDKIIVFRFSDKTILVLILMFHLLLLTDGYVFNINSVAIGFGSWKKSKSCVATTKHYIFVFQVSFVHSVLRIASK